MVGMQSFCQWGLTGCSLRICPPLPINPIKPLMALIMNIHISPRNWSWCGGNSSWISWNWSVAIQSARLQHQLSQMSRLIYGDIILHEQPGFHQMEQFQRLQRLQFPDGLWIFTRGSKSLSRNINSGLPWIITRNLANTLLHDYLFLTTKPKLITLFCEWDNSLGDCVFGFVTLLLEHNSD